MHSGEVNLRYWADMPPGPFDVSYLVGARYMRINEQYNFVADIPVPDTINDADSAPFMPRARGVSTISAPSRRSSTRRSMDMLSGMVRMQR